MPPVIDDDYEPDVLDSAEEYLTEQIQRHFAMWDVSVVVDPDGLQAVAIAAIAVLALRQRD